MKTGLLWLDDDARKALEDKVLKAAAHYERKYGRAPNLCFVNTRALDGNRQASKAGSVEIRAGRSVLPHHFWPGVAERDISRPTRAKQVAGVSDESQ